MAFPLQLDTYDFATPELKAQLHGPRSTEAAVEEERDAVVKRQKREAVGVLQSVLNSALRCASAVEVHCDATVKKDSVNQCASPAVLHPLFV